MKKDNDNAKEKHAKSNSKHQKAVALRTQWLKDNPDKKKEDIIQTECPSEGIISKAEKGIL